MEQYIYISCVRRETKENNIRWFKEFLFTYQLYDIIICHYCTSSRRFDRLMCITFTVLVV